MTKQQTGNMYISSLAMLFAETGWTQDELAQVEGKNRAYISKLLTFGRFLEWVKYNNVPMGTKSKNSTIGLSERKFRAFWKSTDAKKNDYQRFVEVLKLVNETTTTTKKNTSKRNEFVKALGEQFGDGVRSHIETGSSR